MESTKNVLRLNYSFAFLERRDSVIVVAVVAPGTAASGEVDAEIGTRFIVGHCNPRVQLRVTSSRSRLRIYY
jgi:hypothetical protein